MPKEENCEFPQRSQSGVFISINYPFRAVQVAEEHGGGFIYIKISPGPSRQDSSLLVVAVVIK